MTKFQLLKNKKGTREEVPISDEEKFDSNFAQDYAAPEYAYYDLTQDYGYDYNYDYSQQVPYQEDFDQQQYYYQGQVQDPHYQAQPMNYDQGYAQYYDQGYNNQYYEQNYNNQYYDQGYNNQYYDQGYNQYYDQQYYQPDQQYAYQQDYDFGNYNGEYYEVNADYNNYNNEDEVSPKHYNQSITQSTDSGVSFNSQAENVGSKKTFMKYCVNESTSIENKQALSSN